MKYCPKCGQELSVSDSRVRQNGYIHRKRDCKECWVRIPTIELPTEEYKRILDENKEIKALMKKVKDML